MGGNPFDPLTTTNSRKELIMAKANHKTRPAAREEPFSLRLPLLSLPEVPGGSNKPFIPWMQVTDALLAHLGFLPGERVYFSVDYIKRHILIRQAFD
jgi:hypothetical protein